MNNQGQYEHKEKTLQFKKCVLVWSIPLLTPLSRISRGGYSARTQDYENFNNLFTKRIKRIFINEAQKKNNEILE